MQEHEKCGARCADDGEGDQAAESLLRASLSGRETRGRLPGEAQATECITVKKRHTGYAFEDPAHEGYHAKQARMSLGPQQAQTSANARTSHLLAECNVAAGSGAAFSRSESTAKRGGSAGKTSSKKKLDMNVVVSRVNN